MKINQQEIIKAVQPWMKQLEALYISTLKGKVSPNSELLKTTLIFDYNTGLDFSISLNAPAYWYYFENGRKSGKRPPIQEILKWIKLKPIVPKAINGKIPSAKQLAFVIAKSIGEKGTQGKRTLPIFFKSPGYLQTMHRIKYSIANEIVMQFADDAADTLTSKTK